MAVNPIQLFTNLPGAGGGAGDYGEDDPRELRRLLAQLLQRDDDVIRHPLQGVANLADTAFKGLAYQQAKAREAAQGKEAGELLAGLYRQMTGNAGGNGNAGPVTGRGMPTPPPRALRPSDPSPETPLPQAAPNVDDQPIPPGDFGGARTPENALGMDALDNLDRTLPPAPAPAPAPVPAPEVAAPPAPVPSPTPGPSGAPMPMAGGGGAPMAGAAPAPPPPVQFAPPEPTGPVGGNAPPPLQMQAPAWAKQGPQGGRAAVAAALAGDAPQGQMPPTIPTMAGFEDPMPASMPQDIARPVGAPPEIASGDPTAAMPAAAPPQAISPARAQIAELLASNGAPQQVASLGPMDLARPAPPPESVASGSIIGPDLNYPTKAPRAVPGYDVSDILTGGNSLRSAYGWAGTDKTWQGLGPYEKAAAMALMEADGMRPDDARNALGSMINRAAKGNEDLGAHVSGQIYQPTWEGAQRNRLARILSNPQHGELTQWAERRAKGLEDDPVQGATHFLAPESTMLALERGNPSKYRSWRKWTNFDADAGEYRGVITRDKSHAFLAPEGRYQPDGGRPPPAQTAEAPRAVYDLPQADVNTRVADASGRSGFALSEDQFKRMLANPRTRPIAQQYLNQMMQQRMRQQQPEDFGKAGTIVQDKDGNFYSVQFGDRGQRKIERLDIGGNGLSPSKGIGEIDTGTGTRIIDKSTGRDVREINKDIIGRERMEKEGAGLGQARVDLPKVEQSAAGTLKYIDDVLNDPNLSNVTGWQGNLPTLTPTSRTTESRIKQLTGRAFLSAFESLKGAGQITEIEGAKATEALARLTDLKQSDAGFKQALNDFKSEVSQLVELARRKAGGGTVAPPSGQQPSQSGGWGIRRLD